MKMRLAPLFLCAFALLALPGDAFRAKLKGRPVSKQADLDPQDMPEPAAEESQGLLRRLMDYFWEPEHDEDFVESFVDSVMSEEDRAQVRGEPLQQAHRRLRGGGRGGGSRGGSSSRGTSSGGSTSRNTGSSSRSYSGYVGSSNTPSRTRTSGGTAPTRSSTSYTRKTTTVTTTSYSYSSRRSYSSGGWGGYSYGYGYPMYGAYYFPPYYPSLYFYPVGHRSGWSSSDYCYQCNRMGSNGAAQNMDQNDLAAIDGALDILYSDQWDTETRCDATGQNCRADPDFYKAMVLDYSEGFNTIKAFPQIAAEWRSYTTSTNRPAVYKTNTCITSAFEATGNTKQTACGQIVDATTCQTYTTSPASVAYLNDCVWMTVGQPVTRRTSRRRLTTEAVTERDYTNANAENRFSLMNAIEHGREEVSDGGGSAAGMIAGIVVGVICLCCTFFLLWFCCCRDGACDSGDDHYAHEEHHQTTTTTVVTEEVEVVEGGGQTGGYTQQQQPQGTPQTITLSGAGSYQVNGLYQRQGDQNGHPKYIKSDNPQYGIMFDDNMWWVGDTRPATADFYSNRNTSQDVPLSNWGVCDGGGASDQGQLPFPTFDFGYGGGYGGYGNEGVQVYS